MRAQHIRLVAIVFFLASIFNSCSESTSPSSPTEIVPLKEGNRWIYSISDYDSVHALRWTILDTIEIGAPTIHDGKIWYPYISITNRLNTLNDTLFYRNENDGLWGSFLVYSPHHVYKYPAAIGDTFNINTSNFPDTSTLQRRFIQVGGLQDIITVPAGTFSCIRYDEHYQILNPENMNVLQDDVSDQSYVAPGIGLIKSIRHYALSTGPVDSPKTSKYSQEAILISYRF